MKNTFVRRMLACVIALVMGLSVCPMLLMAETTPASVEDVNTDHLMNGYKIEAAESQKESTGRKEIVNIMVELEGDPAMKAAGSLKAAESVERKLEREQEAAVKEIEALLGTDIDVKFNYTLLFNGFSFKGQYGWIEKINSLDGYRAFRAAEFEAPTTEKGVAMRTIGSTQVGASTMWNAGYNGAGNVVAIIDTGLIVGHNAFAVAPSSPAWTSSTVSSFLSSGKLNASGSASNVYYSAKVPFRWNYYSNSYDVLNSAAGYHGTHVAGIVAGNPSNGTIKGIAYNSQLAIMQVFNNEGGASFTEILAALEDCVYLGVDAANLSLGSDCGFTTYYDPSYAEVFELLGQAGVNLAMAAGNAGQDTITGNAWGGYQLYQNPDYGIVGSPSTWNEALSIAACNSSGVPTDFTSWGTTSDLRLKPELMAPGYSIYSSYGSSTSSYSSLSGTSMACPHVAGGMALLTAYVEDEFSSLSAEQRMNMVDTLLICTANPTSYSSSSGTYYSPRQQGAGVMDLAGASTTSCYVSANYHPLRPLMEIGDDKTKSGVYTISFDVTNFGTTSQTYTISANAQTESIKTKSVSSSNISASSISYIDGTPYALGATVTTNHSGNKITVAAGQTVSVTVTITLNSTGKTYMDRFPNGMYVEGFVTLTNSSSTTSNLSVPYLSFYGDWNYPATIDHGYYWMSAMGEDCYQSHPKINTLGYASGSTVYGLGLNPYTDTTDWNSDRCSISPNGDGKYDSVNTVYVGVIRNSINAYYRLYTEDMSDYDSLLEWNFENKGYYMQTGTYTYTYVQCGVDYCQFPEWDGGNTITVDEETVTLDHTYSEGDTAVIAIGFELDYEGFTHEANEGSLWLTPVTIDTTAPEVVSMRMDGDNLVVTLKDNHYAAYAAIYSNSSYSTLISGQAIAEDTRAATSTVTFPTGGRATVYLFLGDYAGNEYKMTVDTASVPSEAAPVTGFSIDETLALDLGTSAAIGTVVEPADASDYSIAWTSSATSVATVDNGTVTAMAYGTATITATLTDNAGGGTFTDTCVVTVAPVNVTGITVTPTAAEVLVGETVSLTAAVTPANASDYTVAWSTNKASVATVNNGVVTGVATGTATITATVTDNLNGNTYSASCEVTVTEFEGFMLADEIEAGGTYIIVAGGQGKAVSNNTVTNNYYLAPVDVTENSDDTLTVESSVNVNEIMWVAEGNSTSGWTFQSVDDGMYMGLDSAQYLAPSTTAIAWLYSENDLNNQVDTDGYYYLSYSAASTSNAYERFTTSKNTGNNIVLYKYVTATAPEPTTYTVTFKDWDGTVLSTQTVEEGAAATAPAAPSRTGYTFTGWDVDFSNVTSDLTVTAQYSVNSYTITYYVDGALYNTQTYAYGAAVTMLAEPTKEGYTFSGWDTTITTMPANDVTVNGTFTLIPVTTYTVTFMANGEVVSTQNVQAGAAATAPAAPEVAGYHFVEWDTDYSNVQSDLVVTAVYTKGLTVMTPGAQVRTSPTKGIRFATTVARDYDVNYIDITSFGTLLMPTAMLGENELTLETENVQNIESLGFSSSSTEERYVYFGSLLGLADSMLSLEITARGYVYYTFGGEQFLAYAQTTVSRSYNGLLGA